MAEPSLDKLLRLAGVSQLETSALGPVGGSEDEAHDHLMKECPWYAAVCNGEGAASPGDHCGPKHSEGGALMKFTPRTAEASTKVQPTVPPGGPGLFHVKGLHLPPYVEHLYPHLVARYGKKEAYRVAVGVVKKWAAGVNPGGFKTKSGKGKKTHPDVQAAASKNVAEWEADKAKGHAQHVKATVPADSVAGVTHVGKLIPTPSPPKKTAPMMTAHRIADMCSQLAHGVERMEAARRTKDPALRKYEMIHVRNHLATALNNGHLLAENLRTHYRAEGRELDAVMKTLGLTPEALTPAMKAATTAHLLQSTLNECTHSIRHADLMLKTTPGGEWEFNANHCEHHLHGALTHVVKLREHIVDNYPVEGRLLIELHDLVTGEIKAAAPAAWPSGKPFAKSFLSPQRDTISAPGAGQYSYGMLKQEPSQTTSPSPPLPPKVDLPSPKEMRAFAGEISKLADDDDHHLAAAQMHLESAAEKMVTNPISALMSLRSTQTAIQQAWRWRVQHAVPRIAYAFSSNTPPAEQSSQQQIWAKEQDRIGEMQSAASKIAVLIDRIRRGYFGRMGMENQTAGGGLAGQPNARL
jgi:hypothetical protein